MAVRARKVLLCYDGSEPAKRALVAAASFIGYGSTLAVANVASDGSPVAGVVLGEARDDLLRRGVSALYLPLRGDPADELVQTASALDVDLVIVGGRSPVGLAATALGPVSADVVQRAPCDVLVVK